MGLPNIGPLELIIILAIALLVVGPGRLPEMGSAIGRTIREFRKASSDMTDAASVESKPAADTQPKPNTLSGEAAPNTTAERVATAPASDAAAPAPAAAGPDTGSSTSTSDAAASEPKAGSAERA